MGRVKYKRTYTMLLVISFFILMRTYVTYFPSSVVTITPQRLIRVWRSDFFGQRLKHREIMCGTLRCVWSSDGESTADVRVYHWVSYKRPSIATNSPSVAMMLESEPNYGLIAKYKAAGFDYSASPDPRSDFIRVAFPANVTEVLADREKHLRRNRIRGATFVARNCNKKRASLVWCTR